MADGGKTPALAILIGKGNPPSPMGKGSGGMDNETESETGGGAKTDEARRTLKKMSGWDDDVLDALRDYVHSCAADIGDAKEDYEEEGKGESDGD